MNILGRTEFGTSWIIIVRLSESLVITVLHVITSIEPGGAEHHLLSLVKAQVKRGYGVVVSYLKSTPKNLRAKFEEAGAKLLPLELKRYGQISPLLKLKSAIRREAPDLVHAHLPPAELYARLALLGCGRTVLIISKHNDERFAPVIGSNCLARWVARQSDATICISHAVKDYWISKKVIKEDQTEVIHYGISKAPETVKPVLRKEIGIRVDDILFGFVGRLVPQKALDNLLDAFALLDAPNAQLVLVGNGPLETSLKELVAQRKIGSRVFFLGHRDDIPNVMASLDVLVLGSDYEGFGLVLLEAMRAGTPVLATRVSAIPEVVEHELTGLLVPPRDPQAMSDGMAKIMSQKLRERMGHAAIKAVENRFGMDQMVSRTEQVYRRTIEKCAA